MARDKTVSTSPTTMGKHGRLREEEAAREKAHDDGFRPAPSFTPFDEMNQRAGEMNQRARPDQKAAPKPVEKAPVTLNGPMMMADVQAALSDRYPHHDIRWASQKGHVMEVAIPGGVVYVDLAKINNTTTTAELRAYIDALPIQ